MPPHSSSRQASLSEHDRLLLSEDFSDTAADLLDFESSSDSEYDDEAEQAPDPVSYTHLRAHETLS